MTPAGILQRFFTRFRFPQLVLLFGALFALDLAIPDVIPFIDEAFLALLTAIFAAFRNRRAEPPAEERIKNVTPQR